jgi:hypothetical protein
MFFPGGIFLPLEKISEARSPYYCSERDLFTCNDETKHFFVRLEFIASLCHGGVGGGAASPRFVCAAFSSRARFQWVRKRIDDADKTAPDRNDCTDQ